MIFSNPNPTLRCLNCSHAFRLFDAPLAPINTPASPDAQIPELPPTLRIGRRQLPFDFNRVCPKCRYPLTYGQATGQLGLHPIAIAGGTGVSKTHTIPIVVEQLKRRLRKLLRGFDIRAQETREPGAAHSICSDQLLNLRYGHLFADAEYGRVIAKTARSVTAPEMRTPLIYRLMFPRTMQFLTGRKCVEFAFRDCAGEEFTEPGAMLEWHRYITHSAGIILLVDPLTVPGIRERMPAEYRRSGRGEARPFEIDNIVSRLINLFERCENTSVKRRIQVPVAVVLAKADLLRGLNCDAASIFSEPDSLHAGGFDRVTFLRQQEALREFLDECGQSEVFSSITSRFEKVGLFAASALGHDPSAASGVNGNGEQRVGHIQPWRVLDPLMWLFHHYGYVGCANEQHLCTN